MTTVGDVINGAKTYELAPPEPLRREIEPPEPYPIDALGDVLAPAARVLHAVIKSPDAICAQSVLAAATLATQGHTDVLIDGRRLPLSEFFISVGESGVRKSATDWAALAPVAKRQRVLLGDYAFELQEAAVEIDLWKREREEALHKKTKAERREALEALGLPPSQPPFPMLTTEEPTYEGLVKLLDGGWPTVGLFSDEGGRFLVSSPISTLGEQLYVEIDYTADPAYKKYFARLSSTLETKLPWEVNSEGKTTGGVAPRVIQIAPDGKRIWIMFHDWVQVHLREDGVLRPISGIAAKAAEHALRLAGVLALTDDIECSYLLKRHVEQGVALARFYLSEALRLFDTARTNPDLVLAEKLLLWLRAKVPNSKSSNNSSGVLIYPALVYQLGPNALRDKATAKKIIAILENHGWLYRIDGVAVVDGKHRQEVWSINPALWGA